MAVGRDAAAAAARVPLLWQRARPLPWKSPPIAAAAAVAGITVLAFVLRMLTTRGLWLDEATSVFQSQLPFGQMLDSLRSYDLHPPLYHSVLWVTTRAFGTGELAVRLPSLLAGTLVVPMLYVAGRDLYDRRTGLAAAMLGAVAPMLVWYAQEARMYGLFMLFALIAVWAQARAVEEGRTRHWVIYTLATVALVWTHYFAFLLVLVQQVAFAAILWRRRRGGQELRPLARRWAGSMAVLALALLPLLPFIVDQLQGYWDPRGGGAGLLPARAGGGQAEDASQVYTGVANAIWAVWGYHADGTMANLVALWPLGMLVPLFLLGSGRSRATALVAAGAVGPFLLVFALGTFEPAVLEVRYFAGALPLIVLLLARGATRIAAGPAAMPLAVVAAAGTLLAGVIDQQANGLNPRFYDFEGALEAIERDEGPHDLLLYEPDYLASVVSYYSPGIKSRALQQGMPHRGRKGRIIVFGSFDFRGGDRSTRRANRVAARLLRQDRDLVSRIERQHVVAQVFR